MPIVRVRSLALAGLALGLLLGFAPQAQASCGSAFCSMSSDWNMQGVWTDPGFRVDLRYEYILLDQPMSGGSVVPVGALPRDHNEIRTVNQNLLTTVDYAFSEAWSLSVAIPYLDRDHKHFDTGTQQLETWKFTELGDVRVLARYQVHAHDPALPGPDASVGFDIGLKLPTGRTNVTNAAGETAERTLQPGSGSTDLLFGAFYRQRVGLATTLFVQALRQVSLDSKDGFQPGPKTHLDFGVRTNVTHDLALGIQANVLIKGLDSGTQAEPEDSGGTFVFLSPGVSYALTDDFQVYGFYQLPVYQYVNGLQLTSKDSYALGASMRF
jgi:hypothetical protein